MPPVVAAAATAWTAIGAAAAGTGITALAATAFQGAVYGAAIGAATSAITGQSISKGALRGAMMGGVGGAVVKGVSLASDALTGVEAAGSVEGVTEGAGAVNGSLGVANQIEKQALMNAGGSGATTTAAPQGIIGKVGNWMESNPVKAGIIGNTLAGAATSTLQAKQQADEMKALLRANQVTGLDELELKNILPSISGFTAAPKWKMAESEGK